MNPNGIGMVGQSDGGMASLRNATPTGGPITLFWFYSFNVTCSRQLYKVTVRFYHIVYYSERYMCRIHSRLSLLFIVLIGLDCASGCVVECRICNREVAGLNLGLGYFAPRFTQPSIPPGSVNEYQL